eukprot:CAMPEP_0170175752 /NCGR_PEP_ID=MMETSP0040_2-20121228/8779_1 /TAXON_ID=641309 /ORGANISM="Lotharella oceanica, Strain CCMP622" /LENGTH=150 /DNA_ID=CAMNT_0010417851 /DNA_START=40 /DNA_END=492 /DNA_ORIENTATION=+
MAGESAQWDELREAYDLAMSKAIEGMDKKAVLMFKEALREKHSKLIMKCCSDYLGRAKTLAMDEFDEVRKTYDRVQEEGEKDPAKVIARIVSERRLKAKVKLESRLRELESSTKEASGRVSKLREERNKMTKELYNLNGKYAEAVELSRA